MRGNGPADVQSGRPGPALGVGPIAGVAGAAGLAVMGPAVVDLAAGPAGVGPAGDPAEHPRVTSASTVIATAAAAAAAMVCLTGSLLGVGAPWGPGFIR